VHGKLFVPEKPVKANLVAMVDYLFQRSRSKQIWSLWWTICSREAGQSKFGRYGGLFVSEKPVKANLVAMVDYFTKAAKYAIIHDKFAAAVAKAFYHSWICRCCVPAYVTCDNGQEA
jgi:hypothetical protein